MRALPSLKLVSMLRIDKMQYERIYRGLNVPKYELFETEPTSVEDVWANYMTSKLWRLNSLYTITDKDGNLVRYVMNWAQHVVYAATLRHPRIIVLKSRQQGISTHWLVSYFDDAIIEDNFEIGLMTQGLKESKTLFRRVKRLWDELPDFVKEFLELALLTDTKEEIGFSNGSTMYIQTSFRSGTLQRLHISEFGKIAFKYPEKALETKTGTLQTIRIGNTVVIESTAETGDNEFKNMWDIAEGHVGPLTGKDFVPVFLSWANDPDCVIKVPQVIDKVAEEYFADLEVSLGVQLLPSQKNWWIAQKRELGEEMGREYPGTAEEAFEVARDGSYYGALYRDNVLKLDRYVENLHDASRSVYISIDLGISDDAVWLFFQVDAFGSYYIIDEYHNSGEALSHYVDHAFSLGYDIAEVFVPHDAIQRDKNRAQSTLDRLDELGVRNVSLLPKLAINFGIEQVRKLLGNRRLWVDSAKCAYIHASFKNYTKEWDTRLGQWKDKPLHNEWSHPADAIRYMMMSDVGTSDFSSNDAGSEERKKRNKRRERGESNVCDGLAL